MSAIRTIIWGLLILWTIALILPPIISTLIMNRRLNSENNRILVTVVAVCNWLREHLSPVFRLKTWVLILLFIILARHIGFDVSWIESIATEGMNVINSLFEYLMSGPVPLV